MSSRSSRAKLASMPSAMPVARITSRVAASGYSISNVSSVPPSSS